MKQLDVVQLTKEILSFNTINPPGNEKDLAKYLGQLLSSHGFSISFILFEKNRLHVIAEKGLTPATPPLVLSGHMDVVPLGDKKWMYDPFSGEIIGDKIYGRGSSDMKGGLAALIIAAINTTEKDCPKGGLRLILSAGEELGCQGISQLTKDYKELGEAKAIIIAEPTSNIPKTGHKGALYLNNVAKGITAHSSMPELGENAIYKVVDCISKIAKFQFNAEKDNLLGYPTINVGKIHGGINLNSVPDHAEFTIDVRSTGKINHKDVLSKFQEIFEDKVLIETLVDLNPVITDENNPFVQQVYKICELDSSLDTWNKSLPYMTDGSVLQAHYKGVPTIILGPGEASMAHQTDEYCFISKLKEAVSIYQKIICLPQ